MQDLIYALLGTLALIALYFFFAIKMGKSIKKQVEKQTKPVNSTSAPPPIPMYSEYKSINPSIPPDEFGLSRAQQKLTKKNRIKYGK